MGPHPSCESCRMPRLGHCNDFTNAVDCIVWAHRCTYYGHPMLSNGPSISCGRCCRCLGMGHICCREYAAYGVEWAHVPLERAAECLGWAMVTISKMLSIVLYGPTDAPTMGIRCSRMGPAYLLGGAADPLEWATFVAENMLRMELNGPTSLL